MPVSPVKRREKVLQERLENALSTMGLSVFNIILLYDERRDEFPIIRVSDTGV